MSFFSIYVFFMFSITIASFMYFNCEYLVRLGKSVSDAIMNAWLKGQLSDPVAIMPKHFRSTLAGLKTRGKIPSALPFHLETLMPNFPKAIMYPMSLKTYNFVFEAQSIHGLSSFPLANVYWMPSVYM